MSTNNSWTTHDGSHNRDTVATIGTEPPEELVLENYELEDIETERISHGSLEEIEATLEYEHRTYELIITEQPDRGAKVRASPESRTEVYSGRLSILPSEENVEEILESETLDRTY